MRSWTRVAVLLLLAVGARGDFVLTPGPERLLGEATLTPWNRSSRSTALATDGDESVLLWFSHDSFASLYAVRIDREGQTLTPVPIRLLEGVYSASLRYATWIDGQYLVFFSRYPHGMQVLRLTRDLEVLELRTLGSTFERVQRIDDELVLSNAQQIVRLRSDLTPIGNPLKLPDGGQVAAGSGGRYAILHARLPVSTMRLFDGRTFSELIRYEPVSNATKILWTGSEFLVYAHPSLFRFDRDLRPIGEPVKTEVLESLTALGDDLVWVTFNKRVDHQNRLFGQRLRLGMPVDPAPIELRGEVVPLRTSDGRLIAVDYNLSLAVFPPPGGDDMQSVPWHPVAFSAREEQFAGAGVSPTEVAVARRTTTYEHVVTVMKHDGAVLREIPLQASFTAIASDGRDLFVFTGGIFQKLVPGAIRASAAAGNDPLNDLQWTGSEFVTAWSNHLRVERISPDGEMPLPCATRVPGLDETTYPPPKPRAMAAGDGEVLVSTYGQMAWFRDGCPKSRIVTDPLLQLNHRLSWQDGRWAIAFTERDGGPLRIGFTTRKGAPFVATPGEIAKDATLISFVPAGGRWAVLYQVGPAVIAALLDADGNPIATGVVTHDSAGAASLLALPDGRFLASYTRRVKDSPFLDVPRVFWRFLTLEEGSRRRGVRH